MAQPSAAAVDWTALLDDLSKRPSGSPPGHINPQLTQAEESVLKYEDRLLVEAKREAVHWKEWDPQLGRYAQTAAELHEFSAKLLRYRGSSHHEASDALGQFLRESVRCLGRIWSDEHGVDHEHATIAQAALADAKKTIVWMHNSDHGAHHYNPELESIILHLHSAEVAIENCNKRRLGMATYTKECVRLHLIADALAIR